MAESVFLERFVVLITKNVVQNFFGSDFVGEKKLKSVGIVHVPKLKDIANVMGIVKRRKYVAGVKNVQNGLHILICAKKQKQDVKSHTKIAVMKKEKLE